MAKCKIFDTKNLDLRAIGEAFGDMKSRPAHEWTKSKPLTGDDAIIERYLETRDISDVSDKFDLSSSKVIKILNDSGVI